jgi:hypothetical protein
MIKHTPREGEVWEVMQNSCALIDMFTNQDVLLSLGVQSFYGDFVT